MTIFHTTAIGYKHGALLKIERFIDADSHDQAAQKALDATESMAVSVNSIIVSEKQAAGKGRPRAISRDDLRAPFYAGELCRVCAVINARHLPEDERQGISSAIQSGAMDGMIGRGRVALIVSTIDPMGIEDELPALSTLVQIAWDESIDMLVLDVEGPYIEKGDTYPE